MNENEIIGIIEECRNKGGLLGILEEIKSRTGALPRKALKVVADYSDYSYNDIFSVAIFNGLLGDHKKGEHVINVCSCSSCHIRGARDVVDLFVKHLGIEPGKTTKDGKFTLETIRGLGRCTHGPVVIADGRYFLNVKPSDVRSIISRTLEGCSKDIEEHDEETLPLDISCLHCHKSLLDGNHLIENLPSVHLAVSYGKKSGWVKFSGRYGSTVLEYDDKIARGKVLQFFCPHCYVELTGNSTCIECGAPMVPLRYQNNVIFQFCSRSGCRRQVLDY